MRPIETQYRGYRFRSRLEARWAVFFDALSLEWEYEPEGFVLKNGTWYLPDFRVRYPGQGPRWSGSDGPHDVWFEVKAAIELISADEWSKLEAFDSERQLIILDGVPGERLYMRASDARAHGRRSTFDEGMALWSSKGRLWWDTWENIYLADNEDFDRLWNCARAARAARFAGRAA